MKMLPAPRNQQQFQKPFRTFDRFFENQPYSVEAEAIVIGSIMIDGSLFKRAKQFLDNSWFHSENHRVIFTAMEELTKLGMTTDVVAITNKLKEMGRFVETGGTVYLIGLINNLQGTHQFSTSLRIVLEKGKARRIMKLAVKLAQSCVDGAFSDITVEQFKSGIDELYRDHTTPLPYSVVEGSRQMLDDIAARREAFIHGAPFPTGLSDLDNKTGGLSKKCLSVIGGKTSIGKTSMMTQFAWNLAHRGFKVLYFSTEMNEPDIRDRIVTSALDLDYFETARLGRITEENKQRIRNFSIEMHEKKLWILFKPAITAELIKNDIERMNPDFVFVDYLQQVKLPGKDRPDKEITDFCYTLKDYSADYNLGVVLGSQLSRAIDKGDREVPRLSDLRESGGIEISADLVLLLHRRKEIKSGDTATAGDVIGYITDILVAKQRNGPVCKVKSMFKGASMRFEPLEREYEEAE